MSDGPFDEALSNARITEENVKNRETRGTKFIIEEPKPVAVVDNMLLDIPNYSGVQKAALKTSSALITTSGLTNGSVLFYDGTNIAQDNANLFWDDTNNRLGIGITTPNTLLEVSGDQPQIQLRGTSAVLRLYDTTATVGRTWDIFGSDVIEADLNFKVSTTQGGTPTTSVLYLDGTNQRIGMGTTSPNFLLDVNGTANATTLSGAYVTSGLGDIIYRNATENVRLLSGSANQVLTMQATGIPNWAASAGGGGTTISGSGTFDPANLTNQTSTSTSFVLIDKFSGSIFVTATSTLFGMISTLISPSADMYTRVHVDGTSGSSTYFNVASGYEQVCLIGHKNSVGTGTKWITLQGRVGSGTGTWVADLGQQTASTSVIGLAVS